MNINDSDEIDDIDDADDVPSESELRIELAKRQNEILKRIYKNITADGFDTNLDLDDIDSVELRDFWVYTAGFLGVQNFESLNLTERDVKNIMSGRFVLKEVSLEEGEKIVRQAGKRLKNGGYAQTVSLYKIQDGEYFFNKNCAYEKDGRRYTSHFISLQTDKPEYQTSRTYFEDDDDHIFTIIRNFLVHRIPYVKGSKIALFDNKDLIVVTKMWLRGYSELFSKLSTKANPEDIKKKLYNELAPHGIYIDTPQEVDKALSFVKDCFDKETQEKYYRVNNFVKRRLEYFGDFYGKSFDEKIEIIAQICANNPNFVISSSGKINPSIVYNLQKLVTSELDKRGEEAIVTEDDYDSEKLQELYARHDELTKKLRDFDEKHPVIRSRFERMQNENFIRQLSKLEKDFAQQLEYLKNRSKLESSHMNLYHAETLENLPVEVAVNVVCLMGYNSLVTSAFYEDLLANTDSSALNQEQRSFFSRFDTSKLTITRYEDKIKKTSSAEEKAYILYCLRNAICHGQISFTLPPVKQGKKASFKDAMLHFVADWDRTTISGTVEDFYKLFSSSPFTLVRTPGVITAKVDMPQNDENSSVDKFFELLEEAFDGDTQPGDDDTGTGPSNE